METRIFRHQLGKSIIRVFDNGSATYNHKRYSSYQSARRALTKRVGYAYEVK